MIPTREKEKISFCHRSQVPLLTKTMNMVDLCFIDGDHTDENIIWKDFEICNMITKPGGIILFDDYHPNKFAVKSVVDKILKKYKFKDVFLVPFHGHLFDEENKHIEDGMIVLIKE